MTVYAHIENDTITGVYDLLPSNWRNISNFSALVTDTDFLYSLGWRTIVKDTPVYDNSIYTLGNPSYSIVDDSVVETRPLLPKLSTQVQQSQPLSEEQIAEQQNIMHLTAMVEIRSLRDILLNETDFTQLSDVIQLNGEELTQQYNAYRQQLRDLPSLYESDLSIVDVNQVTFPTKPGN